MSWPHLKVGVLLEEDDVGLALGVQLLPLQQPLHPQFLVFGKAENKSMGNVNN